MLIDKFIFLTCSNERLFFHNINLSTYFLRDILAVIRPYILNKRVLTSTRVGFKNTKISNSFNAVVKYQTVNVNLKYQNPDSSFSASEISVVALFRILKIYKKCLPKAFFMKVFLYVA